MEHIQTQQRSLDLLVAKGWTPHAAGRPARIVSGARAAVDVAHALGYDTDGLAGESDATLVLTLGAADAPPRMDKRRLIVDLDSRDAIEVTREWLTHAAPQVLCISGPRRSRQAGAYGRTYAFLSRVLPKPRRAAQLPPAQVVQEIRREA